MSDWLRLSGISKAYPGILANDGIDLTLARGEVHALLGENGAGKSTLVKIIYGLIKPDSGAMWAEGAPYAPTGPSAARATGIGMVFQHFSLFEALSVAENVALGMERPPPLRRLAEDIAKVSEDYGLPLDPGRRLGDLSAGERQRVEIIRCLLQSPRLLIMDEPTSVLTPQEVEILFRTLRQLASEGTAILYISHKLDEIRRLCHRATILRRGQVVGACDPAETPVRALAEMMVGAGLSPPQRRRPAPALQGTPALSALGLTLPPARPFGTPLKAINFDLYPGEILGIGGVAGNGQDELLEALSGERAALHPEALRLNGVAIGLEGPRARRARGLASAPEDRLGHAAVPDMSLTENALLSAEGPKGLAPRGVIAWPKARAFAEEIITRFDVRTRGPEQAARALSGGNLQKFVIGREWLQKPKVLIVNQPTWGVDAAAAAAIRQALLDAAGEGAAILLISQDLDEILEIADRFAALNGGWLSPLRPVAGLSLDEIGLMMGGAHGMHEAHVAGTGAL